MKFPFIWFPVRAKIFLSNRGWRTTALANLNLSDRIRSGARLNEPSPAAFYGGSHRGYTDHPVLATTER
ncbi:hypothetical protein OG985_43990 [Streptomyces sp. NBC_00289]|uniref:hypothetical protein n=1 Tax=Streptomyces sp. NBC_00289 TaxID=2975703 RepID=UPI003245C05D